MKNLFFLGLFVVWNSQAQVDRRNLLGIYHSDQNKGDRASEVVLDRDYRFVYKYKLGECQGEIRGTWGKVQDKIIFKNDPEFLNNETTQYPDLGLVTWSIRKNAIRPDAPFVACGFTEKGLHRKSKD